MSQDYYYLVSGLPDLVLEGNKSVPSMVEFIEDISEKVDHSDAELLSLLRLPFDNGNLVSLLEEQVREFDTRGNYSLEELESEVRVPEQVPNYMKMFIEARKEGKQLFAGLSPEDQLHWLFYDEMTAHENQFIRDWFSFEQNLRNLVAALNVRRYGQQGSEQAGTLPTSIVGRSDVAESILRSNAPDFSLGPLFPYVERVLGLNMHDVVEFERNLDLLRWDVLNELTAFSYFKIETILAFGIKLSLVDRWQKLDSATGKETLQRLVSELQSGFALSDDFQ